MMFKWFDTTTAEEFGYSLAELFIAKIPLSAAGKSPEKLAKKLDVVDQIYAKINQFKQTNSLNFYQKAKMLDAFRDKLVNAGFSPEVVEQVVHGLIRKL